MAKPNYTVEASAAISRIAAALAPLITNRCIDTISVAMRWPIFGSNKATKIASLLEGGWDRVLRGQQSPNKLQDVISTMTMEGYRRFIAKQVEMKHEHVDEIVKGMRVLKLDGSDLARRGWRSGLPEESRQAPKPESKSSPQSGLRRGPVPVAHPEIVKEVRTLISTTSTVSPQKRGKRLEELVHTVLEAEHLTPRGPMRNPGEELDRGFTIDNIHYLLECKWEDEPIGFPAVRDFIGKVQRKAEGTFGVFLSMSGFVSNINTSAGRGQRLNCIGLTGPQFMDVIEGRSTWCQLVDVARRTASDRGEFQARDRT